MLLPPDTETSLSQSLRYLVQIRRDLLALLNSCDVTESSPARHSLFSSRRVFRSDELYLGLSDSNTRVPFSLN